MKWLFSTIVLFFSIENFGYDPLFSHAFLTRRSRAQRNTISNFVQQRFSQGDVVQDDWNMDANRVEYVVGDSFESLSRELGLNISSALTSRSVVPRHLVSGNDLFCNVDLNLGDIEAIGFDMDWTLAQYTEAFDLLAFDGAKLKLVRDMGYPSDVHHFVYQQDMCLRGMLVDKKMGNFIKPDRHKYVRSVAHGTSPLKDDDRKTLYREGPLAPDFGDAQRFTSIDTPFSLVDACLFARLVDLKDYFAALPPEQRGNEGTFIVSKSYVDLWTDLRRAVDRCHKDGVIKKTVETDPSRYIVYDPNLIPMLRSFKEAGRKVFLATNSLWDYTHVVMNYLEGQRGPGKRTLDWTQYFDVVMVGCAKPQFLMDDHDRNSMFRVDPTSDKLLNVDFVPESGASDEDVLAFLDPSHSRHVFQGGNAQRLHRLLQVTSGDKILYVGDHVYSDVLRSKRSLGWRTCLIVPELTKEIISMKRHRELRRKITNMRKEQVKIEMKLDALLIARLDGAHLSSATPGDHSSSVPAPPSAEGTGDLLTAELTDLKVQLRALLKEYNTAFHSLWGPLFLAGHQDSRLSKQISDYACLYTSCASNLGLVSPDRPFRAIGDRMPHD